MVRRHQGRGALHDEIKEAFDKLVSDHPEIETVSAVGSFSDVEVCKNEKDNEKWSFSIRLKDVRDKKGALVTLEFRGDSVYGEGSAKYIGEAIEAFYTSPGFFK